VSVCVLFLPSDIILPSFDALVFGSGCEAAVEFCASLRVAIELFGFFFIYILLVVFFIEKFQFFTSESLISILLVRNFADSFPLSLICLLFVDSELSVSTFY
jgi:hypothetical protein